MEKQKGISSNQKQIKDMQFFNIILGAFFTFLGLWLIEGIKNKNQLIEKRRNFIFFIKQELSSVSKGLDKLKEVLSYRNYFDFAVLTELEKNVVKLENIRTESVLLTTFTLQQKFIDLTATIANFSSSTRVLQSLYYDKQKEVEEIEKGINKNDKDPDEEKNNLDVFFNQNKIEKLISLIEIKRQIDDFLKQI